MITIRRIDPTTQNIGGNSSITITKLVELGSSSSCDSLKARQWATHESCVFGSSSSSESKCL
jgi:hypothetical protein